MKGPDDKWFDARPSKVETCPRCRGSGQLGEGYALRPTEYVLDAPNEAIRAMVLGSFDIWTACREAADIARRSGEPVAFEFIGHTVVVRPGDEPESVGREWWQKRYGETPEQSMARR